MRSKKDKVNAKMDNIAYVYLSKILINDRFDINDIVSEELWWYFNDVILEQTFYTLMRDQFKGVSYE